MQSSELSFLVTDDEGLREILESARTVAVIGLSSDPSRPSYDVASYLQSHGYQVVPVNPKEQSILGERCVRSLAEATASIDVVDVFRRSEQVAPHVDEAIAAGAKVLWLQLGVVDPVSARRAHEAGLKVVMDRCMLQEHSRLGIRKR